MPLKFYFLEKLQVPLEPRIIVRVRNVTALETAGTLQKDSTPHSYFNLRKTLESAVLYRARTMLIYVSILRISPNPSYRKFN
jgi:hypothetical protein